VRVPLQAWTAWQRARLMVEWQGLVVRQPFFLEQARGGSFLGAQLKPVRFPEQVTLVALLLVLGF